MRIGISVIGVAALCGIAAAQGYDSGGFEGFTPGSLEGAPQFGWEGFDLGGGDPGAVAPAIVDLTGNKKLQFEVSAVPADNGIRQESRAVLTLPSPITIADYTQITVSFDITLDADGSGNRHNMYWDFDSVPNRFGPQTINDGGNVAMVEGGTGMNLANGFNGQTVNMTWVFDVTNGTVDTFFAGTQIDNDVVKSLSTLTGGTEFTHFSIALVKDFRTADFGDTVHIDNFVVTAIPAPGAAALLGVGGLVALRRRR